jgi:N-glycosylase/DNA lyase
MFIKVNNLNLKDTITCGQIFRFIVEDDDSYTVILPDRVVNLKLDNDKLIIDSNNMDNIEEVIRKYLDLDYDYDKVNKEIIKVDKSKKEVVDFCNGLKMINEPRFEVVISYILSANNGVPQIRNSLNNISERFGTKVIFRNKTYYLFPSVDMLKNVSIDDYRECKAGFRDKYIYEFVQKIINKEIDLDSIERMDSNNALNYLMSIKGIGEKVASCILLFGYHRFDVYPIDTWVKKYMKDNYNLTTVKQIREYMKDKYKENSGLFIQYIFDYSRNKKD